MNYFKSLIVASFLALGLTAVAQTADQSAYEFNRHWFINLQGGAQHTLGETKFDKLISPNVQFGLGYQFSSWFATRLQANAWQSKGGYSGVTEVGTPAPQSITYKFKYVAPGLDFMFNLSNAFCGFNPHRVFNVTAFVGAGANVAFDNGEANTIASSYSMRYNWEGTKVRPFGRGGIELGFRLSDAVRFVVEANANILDDHYNSKKAGNADWYFNGLAGFRINLAKTYTKKVVEMPEPTPVVEAVPVQEPVKVVEPEPAPEPVKVEPFRRDVFFTINSARISVKESVKMKEMVDYLKANPDAKVAVTGYADAGTGNNIINDRLARLRAQIVVKTLKEKYGIAANRITSDSKGARVQPFAENNKNRVSICIAE